MKKKTITEKNQGILNGQSKANAPAISEVITLEEVESIIKRASELVELVHATLVQHTLTIPTQAALTALELGTKLLTDRTQQLEKGLADHNVREVLNIFDRLTQEFRAVIRNAQ